MQKIFTFCHATDFWGWHDLSAVPSALPLHIRSVRVFKDGVSLLSEDVDNCQAGRILLECNSKEAGNQYFLMCLLFAISDECGTFAPFINGIVATIRKSSSSSSNLGVNNKSNNRKQPTNTAATAGSLETTIRIEVWLHSSITSTLSLPATTTTTTTDGGSGDGSLIQQFTSKLSKFLQLNNNSIVTNNSTTNSSSNSSGTGCLIKYQPHYNAEEKVGK